MASAFADGNYRAITIGYVVMRLAMVVQWVRAARADRLRRGTTTSSAA